MLYIYIYIYISTPFGDPPFAPLDQPLLANHDQSWVPKRSRYIACVAKYICGLGLIGLHFGCLVGANMGCERGFCRRLILEERRLARSYIRNVLYKQYIYIYIGFKFEPFGRNDFWRGQTNSGGSTNCSPLTHASHAEFWRGLSNDSAFHKYGPRRSHDQQLYICIVYKQI